jgi:hypothetical protein
LDITPDKKRLLDLVDRARSGPFTELPQWEDWLNDYERRLIERDRERYFNEYFKVHKPVWNRAVGVIRSSGSATMAISRLFSNK